MCANTIIGLVVIHGSPFVTVGLFYRANGATRLEYTQRFQELLLKIFMHCFRVIRYKCCNIDKFEFVEQTYFYRNDGLFFYITF
jgi:hypothetical protein